MRKVVILLIMILSINIVFGEYVNKIRMVNSTFTKKEFIFNQLIFRSGDYVDKMDVEESILNLKKTNLFGKVLIEAVKIDSLSKEFINIDFLSEHIINDTIDIYITAKEMTPLMPSLGFELNEFPEKYLIALALSFSNLWRERHIIEGIYTFGYVTEFAFRYHIPSVYSRAYNCQFKAAYTTITKPYIGLNELHKKVVVGGGYSFHSKIVPELSIGFDRISIAIGDSNIDTVSIDYLNGTNLGYDEFMILQFNLKTDFRNDPFYPRKGIYSEFNYEYNINFWNQDISRWKMFWDIRSFADANIFVIGLRNQFTLQNGTLTRYNLTESKYFENRCIADSELVGMNRYSGNLELRYSIPFLYYPVELPAIGSFSIGTMVVVFSDWTYIADDIGNINWNSNSLKWGYGLGIRLYSEIFNLLGVDIGFDSQKSLANGLKINLAIFSWNF